MRLFDLHFVFHLVNISLFFQFSFTFPNNNTRQESFKLEKKKTDFAEKRSKKMCVSTNLNHLQLNCAHQLKTKFFLIQIIHSETYLKT